MPHRPTQHHHLNLPEPEPLPYPSSILGGGSTPTKHPPKPTATKFSPQNPDLIQPSHKPSPSFMLEHFSNLNIISHKPQKPPQRDPPVQTHLQERAPKLIAKRPSKEKPLKCKKEVERRKLDDDNKEEKEKGVMKKRGFHHHSKVLFEDASVNNNKVEKNSGVVDDYDNVVVKRHSVSHSDNPSNGGGGGNRRRSFCGSQVVVDLGDVFAVNGVKVVSADMPPFMQIHAVDCARKAFDSMEKFTSKTLALTLKKEFDGVYGPAWHCIVGTNFGSFVTHSVGGFLYFSMDQKYYILLFKTAVQKAG